LINLVLNLKRKAKNSIKMKKIQCQAIFKKCPMLLKLLRNLKSKAVKSIKDRNQKFMSI